MKINRIAAAAAFACLVSTSLCALAAPIAPHPPVSKLAKRMRAAHPELKGPKPCPEAAVVRIPAYPGSYCMKYSASFGKNIPAYVDLLSKAPVKTVRQWYAKHLKGWQDKYETGHFTPVGWTSSKGPFEPTVMIEKAEHTSWYVSDYEKGYDLSGVKTHIQIRYSPK